MKESKTQQKEVQDFLELQLPDHIIGGWKEQRILKKVNQEQIMKAIDFMPPFLRIEKMIIFKDKTDILNSHSIGSGVLTPEDTEGHYNNTIFLAICGRLMGQSASAHLAVLFPDTAPQIAKVDHIKPIISSEQSLWKPNKEGSSFLVETNIVKKRLNVILVSSRISFGNLIFGIADDATIILTPKKSIYSAKELPIF